MLKKQQKFVSYSSGGWDIHEQLTVPGVWWGCASWFTGGNLWWNMLFLISLYKVTNLFRRVLPSWSNFLLKVPSPNIIILGI
jgi:hypothetical protein